jgi:hypothetical protein
VEKTKWWEDVRRQSDREAFLKKQPSASLEQLDSQQGQYMTQNCQSFVLGVCQNKLILSVSLLSNTLNGRRCITLVFKKVQKKIQLVAEQ